MLRKLCYAGLCRWEYHRDLGANLDNDLLVLKVIISVFALYVSFNHVHLSIWAYEFHSICQTDLNLIMAYCWLHAVNYLFLHQAVKLFPLR